MSKILTTCPYAGVGCGLYLDVEGDRVVGIMPSKSHPVNAGSLCVRAWHLYEVIQSPQRLQKPLIKGASGSFDSVSWEEALDLAAHRFREIKEKHGSDSLAVVASGKCTNEDNYLAMKFARAVLGTNNIDSDMRLYDAASLTALNSIFRFPVSPHSIEEIEETEVILVVGSNTTETHPRIGTRIQNAARNGLKLLVVDPRKIALSRFATLHLQPKPATDIIWINGMMKVIIDEGLQNIEFIERRLENFEELKVSLEKYALDYVSEVTGIPQETLLEAARIFASAKKAMIIYSTGVTQHHNGTDNVSALCNLALLTGHIGSRGNGILPLQLQNNSQGVCDVGALPEWLCGYQRIEDAEVRDKFERAWKVRLPDKPGLTLMEMLEAVKENRLRAMYIIGTNPLISCPQSNYIKETLSRLEFLVVQDIFLTETAQLAHLVLPACSFAEKDGTFTNLERRVQRVRAAISPVGESKADWQIIGELSKRMGYEMDYGTPKDIFDELRNLSPIYVNVDYDKLEIAGGTQWSYPEEALAKNKLKFQPVDCIVSEDLPDENFPFILIAGRIAFQWNSGSMTMKSPILRREEPFAFVQIHPEDAGDLGIREGWKIKLVSRNGEVLISARLTEGVPRKCLFMPIHFADAPVNALMKVVLDPKSKTPELKVCAVRIEKI